MKIINGSWQKPELGGDGWRRALDNVCSPGRPFVAIDTETTGLDFFYAQKLTHTKTKGTKGSRAFMATTCNHKGEQRLWWWPVNPYQRVVVYDKTVEEFLDYVDQYDTWVFHNAPFDMQAIALIVEDYNEQLRRHNQPEFHINWVPGEIHDTMAMSHVMNSMDPRSLKDLAIKYCGLEDYDEEQLLEAVRMCRRRAKHLGIPTSDSVRGDYWLPRFMMSIEYTNQLPGEQLTVEETAQLCDEYCLMDTYRTALLFTLYREVVREEKRLYHYIRESRLIDPIYRMQSQSHGLSMRGESLVETIKDFNKRASELTKYLWDYTSDLNFNPNSNDQLGRLLYGRANYGAGRRALQFSNFKRPDWKTPTGKGSTAQETLKEMRAIVGDEEDGDVYEPDSLNARRREVLDVILEYRKVDTALKYLKGYLEQSDSSDTDRIHPKFHPWGTNTTRFSSSSPNAQNISIHNDPPLRKVFGPTKGRVWFCIDYSQLEIRLMAKASGDKTLQKLLDEQGDQHQLTCDAINFQRRVVGLPPITRSLAKNINFAWQYGAGVKKLSAMAGITADAFAEAMALTYPRVVAHMEEIVALAKRQGYIRTLYGYPLTVDRGDAYKGINYEIQGSAGDVLKNSMIAIDEYLLANKLTDRIKMIMCIHDEVVLEAKKGSYKQHLKNIAALMEQAGDPIDCHLPVDVSIVHSGMGWDTKEPYNL